MNSMPRKSFMASDTGKAYAVGPMSALFKTDNVEANGVSECWLEANTRGPEAHSQNDGDVFYVLGGVMSFLIGEEWVDAPKASLVFVPSQVSHVFENRGSVRAGILNFSSAENFKKYMPDMLEWYQENSPGKAGF
ncbi:MAG: cupin domain-containing protein [Pseudomonadota bacterium]